jgi:hypothetical protein
MPLIEIGDDDSFRLNPDAVAFLRSLEGSVAVVAVAGLYRSGKSLLLNLLSGGAGAAGAGAGGNGGAGGGGFAVGGTVKACTRGIWLRSCAAPPPPPPPGAAAGAAAPAHAAHVLFLDTEGLGSTSRSETYDARVFSLALLLSSAFVYNSVGTIDGNAIAKLSLVVQLTRHIHVRAQPGGKEDSGTEFSSFFPTFTWVVRDFAVRLEKDGRKISAREYLEDALRPEEGLSEASEAKNAVRHLLRSFFPERDCVTMVRPVADEKALMGLGAAAAAAGAGGLEALESQLRPEFRSQVEALRRKVVASARPKALYGRALSGAMLASLAGAYVAALNSSATPTIASAWDRVVDAQSADALEGASAAYARRMRELLAAASRRADADAAAAAERAGRTSGRGAGASAAAAAATSAVIVEDEEMLAAHAEASHAAFRLFAQRSIADSERTPAAEARLRERVGAEYQALRRANEAASAAACQALIASLHAAVAAPALERIGAAAAGGAADEDAGAAAADADAEFAAEADADDEDKDEDGGKRGSGGGGGGVDSDEDEGGRGGGVGGGSGVGATAGSAARRGEAALAAGARLRRLAARAVPAATLAAAYRAASSAVREAYLREARGPAKLRVLADYALGGALPAAALAEAAAEADASARRLASALAARAAACERALLGARAQAAAARQLVAQEARSGGAALAEAARVAAGERDALTFRLRAREEEAERMGARFDRLVATFESASVRAEAAAAAGAAELAAARARAEQVLGERVSLLLGEGVAAQRLAESEARRAELERALGEQRLRAEAAEKGAEIMVQRVKAAENETVRLREQTELLYAANAAQQELVASGRDKTEEAEFQWAQTKARNAELEGERAQLQADLAALEALAGRLKAACVAKKGAPKLDRGEQRRYDSLPQGAP